MGIWSWTFAKEKNSISIGSYSYNIAKNTISIVLQLSGLVENSVVIGVGSGVDFGAKNSTVLGTGSCIQVIILQYLELDQEFVIK